MEGRINARKTAQISEEERTERVNKAARILMRGYLRYLNDKVDRADKL